MTLPDIALPSPLPATYESEDFFFSVDSSVVKETVRLGLSLGPR